MIKRITLRISDSEFDYLNKKKISGTTVSEYIRQLIKNDMQSSSKDSVIETVTIDEEVAEENYPGFDVPKLDNSDKYHSVRRFEGWIFQERQLPDENTMTPIIGILNPDVKVPQHRRLRTIDQGEDYDTYNYIANQNLKEGDIIK